MKNLFSPVLWSVIAVLCFTACDKDDPDIENEGELITDLRYTLTPAGGGDAVVLSFSDPDGDDGDDPIYMHGDLAANTSYAGSISMDGLEDGVALDIGAEVEEEALAHQMFFDSNVSGLNVAYADLDSGGNPLGLETTLTTGAAGSGTLTITLRHEPAKDGEGVSGGDITNAGGETDIEVVFNVNVL